MSKYRIFNVKNGNISMDVANLGGIIMRLFAPDAKGDAADIVLGHDSPAEYLKSNCYLGAIAGRVANRIKGGAFSLDGKKYALAKNNGANHLHGGLVGFDKVLWDVKECSGLGWKGLALHYLSSDGEEGYPGNLDVSVYYKLTDSDELVIEYAAHTDKTTLCALTQHSYFNLSGGKAADILGHELQINADFFTPTDATLAPTGEVLSVKGTPLDFRKQKGIGGDALSKHALTQIVGGGFDHNYILRGGEGIARAATLSDPISGRVLDVFTTAPGMQFYSGNFLNGIKGKNKAVYNKHAGLCLETQTWPDAIHNPHFPSAILRPETAYYSATVYKFR